MRNPAVFYIVDDDIDDQLFLEEALLEFNANNECYTASNGKQAIYQLTAGLVPIPDAIFLDLNMPVMDGKQCLQQLKKTLSLKDIPVIIYSTSSDEAEKLQMLKLGAAQYLVKAVSAIQLREGLSSILNQMLAAVKG